MTAMHAPLRSFRHPPAPHGRWLLLEIIGYFLGALLLAFAIGLALGADLVGMQLH
jgi:hypothetical protein